jgi:hypothetical protein
MCNLYSITTNQAAIIALFRVINHHVGNLPPMPGVFPDYPAPVVRDDGGGREMVTMRWGGGLTGKGDLLCREILSNGVSLAPSSYFPPQRFFPTRDGQTYSPKTRTFCPFCR